MPKARAQRWHPGSLAAGNQRGFQGFSLSHCNHVKIQAYQSAALFSIFFRYLGDCRQRQPEEFRTAFPDHTDPRSTAGRPLYRHLPARSLSCVPIGSIGSPDGPLRLRSSRSVPFVQSFVYWACIVPKGTIHITMISDSAALGQLIRAERKRQQLTQEQLAGVAGVGIRFVRELESGKASCRVGLALTVLQTLGLIVSITSRGASS